jgi:hypothetical protein
LNAQPAAALKATAQEITASVIKIFSASMTFTSA